MMHPNGVSWVDFHKYFYIPHTLRKGRGVVLANRCDLFVFLGNLLSNACRLDRAISDWYCHFVRYCEWIGCAAIVEHPLSISAILKQYRIVWPFEWCCDTSCTLVSLILQEFIHDKHNNNNNCNQCIVETSFLTISIFRGFEKLHYICMRLASHIPNKSIQIHITHA